MSPSWRTTLKQCINRVQVKLLPDFLVLYTATAGESDEDWRRDVSGV